MQFDWISINLMSMVLYELCDIHWCDASEKGTLDLPTPEGTFSCVHTIKIIIIININIVISI